MLLTGHSRPQGYKTVVTCMGQTTYVLKVYDRYAKPRHKRYQGNSQKLYKCNAPHQNCHPDLILFHEPRHEKTGFLHMRKQRRRSASQ